jgi:hypothetical protein
MLSCDLCNYYDDASGKKQSKCMCELTGFVFHKKPEEYDLENYPCYDYKITWKKPAEEQYEIIEIAQKKLA